MSCFLDILISPQEFWSAEKSCFSDIWGSENVCDRSTANSCYRRCAPAEDAIYAMIGAGNPQRVVMALSSSSQKGSRLISRMLPVAVKFWLQTQLDDIGELAFEIQATDRQVLSGNIPTIALSAQQAVYQGVRITDVAVQASDIQINIGQVLRGKSLRLKQEFPIAGQVVLAKEDLEASSTDSSLAAGLLDVWQTLLARDDVKAEIAAHYGDHTRVLQNTPLTQYRSQLQPIDQGLMLHLMHQDRAELVLKGSLAVDQGYILRLVTAHWCLPEGKQVLSPALTDFRWNLGEQVQLENLAIKNEQLTCQCRIMVQP